MALVDTVRGAARITTHALDDEILRLSSWARAEMVRVGVPQHIASSETDDLIIECIVAGVMSRIATDENIRKIAKDSFEYQLDVLRKHSWPLVGGDGDDT